MSTVPAKAPPSGPNWIHEITHDGFRILARRDSAGVRLITRNGNDFTARFPLAVAAVASLPANSFLIDGEAIVTNAKGLAVFDRIREKRDGDDAVLIAFDLIELDGEDLRHTPIERAADCGEYREVAGAITPNVIYVIVFGRAEPPFIRAGYNARPPFLDCLPCAKRRSGCRSCPFWVMCRSQLPVAKMNTLLSRSYFSRHRR
jgi:hypothetical protein